MRQPVAAGVVAATLAAVAAFGHPGAVLAASKPDAPPIEQPARVDAIALVASSVVDGWRYDQYRNLAYPCAISGYSTFTVAARMDTTATAVRPLWVYLHGGGLGYFDSTGRPQPNAANKVEESAARQITYLRSGDVSGGLLARVRASAAGDRMLAVSMCEHDAYTGGGQVDPDNPNRMPDGSARRVTGLAATKAAIAWTLQHEATDDYFLHATSAGAIGSWHLAWALQQQGIPPAGVVADSGLFADHQLRAANPGLVCGAFAEAPTTRARRHPAVVDPANAPDHLIADGRLEVPVLAVYTIDDPIWCGAQPADCTIEGVATQATASDCIYEQVRTAIAAGGSGDRSLVMRLCVDDPNLSGACDQHVPTVAGGRTNTIGPWPADYLTPIEQWVTARRGDDGATAPPERSPQQSLAAAALTDFLGQVDQPRAEAIEMALRAGAAKASVLTGLVRSDEWLRRIVDRFYITTLGRPGGDDEVAYWVGELRSGRRSVAQVASSFYASPEYFARRGDLASWARDLYRVLLGRDATTDDVRYWSSEATRRGRTAVTFAFHQSRESASVRVTGVYRDLLGRTPSATDLSYWTPVVVRDGDLRLALVLAASAEYSARAESRFP